MAQDPFVDLCLCVTQLTWNYDWESKRLNKACMNNMFGGESEKESTKSKIMQTNTKLKYETCIFY